MPRTALASIDSGSARPDRRCSAKDVARLAGVSTATVSRVLNSPDQVDARTQDLVRDAVTKLRYVPHGAARALRRHRSQMVGAVVPSFDYALYARTTSAMQAVLDPKGYALVLAEHHYDLEAEVRITEQLIGHGVDAFVFVGLHHDPALFTLLESYGRPYVLTWGVDPLRRHPSIGFDNRAATFEMTRHLIALGHRRFGLLSAVIDGNDRALERGAGMRAALTQAGLELDERCAQYGPIDLAAATAMMRRLLALKKRPTAVVSTNDVFAVGGMIACREKGVRMLVSAGVCVAPRSVLSTPVIEISSGMRTPASRQAIIAPTANTSLVAITAVGRGLRASSSRIAAAPDSSAIGP